MNARKLTLTVLLGVLVAVLCAVGGATAQTTTADESPTNTTTPASDDRPSPSELWQMYQESGQGGVTERSLVMDVGPNVQITKFEFNEEAETVTVWFTADVTTHVSVTDASALDASKTTSKGQSRGITIPRTEEGERIRVTFPATVDSEGNQRITFAPGDGWIYQLSNGQTGGPWFDGRPMYEWFAYFAIAVVIGVSVYIVRRIRKQDSGPIMTADGAQLTRGFQHGLEAHDEDDAKSGGDGD